MYINAERLDELYYSDNPKDVLKFYDKFESVEDLVKWMKSRPRSYINIYEVEGDTDIIIVIPTANVNGQYAKMDLEVYKGFHIIFCESSGRYFNYAYSVNTCVKEAIKYNPEWVIFSNDDVYKIDEPGVLKNELKKLNYKEVTAILHMDKNYEFRHNELRILRPTLIKSYRSFLLGSLSLFYDEIIHKASRNVDSSLIYLLAKAQIDYYKILRKFNLPLVDIRTVDMNRLSYKIRHIIERVFNEYINNFYIKKFGDFGGFSRAFLNKVNGVIFDDTFINGVENYDLSFRLMMKGIPINLIKYRKGSYKGRSLGFGLNNKGVSRNIRNFANFIYFAYKHYDKLLYCKQDKSKFEL